MGPIRRPAPKRQLECVVIPESKLAEESEIPSPKRMKLDAPETKGAVAKKPSKVASSSSTVSFTKIALVLTTIVPRLKVDLTPTKTLTNIVVTDYTQLLAKECHFGKVSSGQTPSVRGRTCLPIRTQGK